MSRRKSVRTRGKIKLSRYFQDFEVGENVAIVKEASISHNFPDRFQGRTGVVKGKRGKAYLVEIMDSKKKKTFLIEPVHLKKIKSIK